MSRKFILVTALWLSAGLSIKTSLDAFMETKGWDLLQISGGRNMLSGCINTFIASSKRAFNQCTATDPGPDSQDFNSKWMVSENPNPPAWMEQGILLP